jgi:AcrR family transcriptional regulator
VPELPDHFLSAPVGREQVSREVLSEHQREAVLVRVTGVFAKRGYQATTVDDLLAAGKVGVSNFYALFDGKEECFLAAYERIVTNCREQIGRDTQTAADWAEEAYLGLGRLLQALLAEPLEARLALIEAQSAGAEGIARYNGLMDAAVDWLRSGRAHYPDSEVLPVGFEQAAVAGLTFYLQQCLLDSRRHAFEELLSETSALILEPIVGRARLGQISGPRSGGATST